jgi:ferredoxin-NADP reductase
MALEADAPPARGDEPGSGLAVPFLVFALVCDCDGRIRARAALRFQSILSRRRRRVSERFTRMLEFCREQYPQLWQGYSRSATVASPDLLFSLMAALERDCTPNEMARLRREVAWLGRRLYRASFAVFARQRQKEAYADFRTVLRGGHPAARAPARGPEDAAAGSDGASRAKPRTSGTPAPGPAPSPDAAPGRPSSVSLSLPADRSPSASGLTEPARPGPPEILDGLPRATQPTGPAGAKGQLKLVCVKVVDEARGVRTFAFAHSHGAWFSYQPGQFLTIEPVIDGKTVPRSYTISSTPTRPGLLEITVKRLPGGVVSNWLHDNMRSGRELEARGPFGKFTCVNFPRDKYLFLSAGSGITPLMSMLRYLHDLAAPVDVIFFHSAATLDDLAFRNELRLCAERSPNIRIELSLTGDTGERPWDGLRGRLDNGMLHHIAPDFRDRAVLACGPPGFMDKTKQLLAGNGFPLATQFAQESFVPKPARSADVLRDGARERKSTVVFVRSNQSVEISSEETILDAATRCNIDIPSSCRQGRCGTCRATKISGDVLMPDQEALSADEVAQGEILTCIGQPASEVVEVEV